MKFKPGEFIRELEIELGITITYQRIKNLEDMDILQDIERTGGNHRIFTDEHLHLAKVALAMSEIGFSFFDIYYMTVSQHLHPSATEDRIKSKTKQINIVKEFLGGK